MEAGDQAAYTLVYSLLEGTPVTDSQLRMPVTAGDQVVMEFTVSNNSGFDRDGFILTVLYPQGLNDLDGDGSVSFSDLGILKSFFFQPPGPSGFVVRDATE